ncbi:Wzz/FepE/Etk N-terminal domain-containing protein [Sphingomonas sp. GV3]|jgi:succinoglycan biosynthesis transport protein ExoP|uniref:GumC family protein n=1 Tax=Sphingomonas sp. GV3 TaxID=3040671 RepID=UPI00259A44C7|nr:Wzz/FepE/Etk N-terminal domain-containing protein [Sphingomonas sp. GV3]
MKQIDDYEAEQGGGGSLLAHLPAIIWQRRWYLIIPIIALTIVGVAAAFVVPVRYTSTATLLVQSSTLPQAVAAGNPDDVIDRRIARIREQVLSRPELIELVNRYQLYPKQRANAALSDIVDTMRKAVTIVPLAAEMQQQGNNSNTIAFTLSYSYADPTKAQAVAQDLSEQVLRLDATQSTQQASASVQFLSDQARSLQQQIAEQERQIAGIKAANGSILSSAGVTMLGGGGGSYDVQIAALQRENSQLLTQRNLSRTADTRDPVVAQAEAQLAAAQSVYSDDHPDVRLARQRLAEAKALARKNVANAPVGAIDEQVAFNNRQIAALRAAQAGESARVNATIGAQSRAPLVQQQIAQLQQKLDGLNEQYKGVSDRLFQARAGVKAENEQLGERLSIVNPPVVPDEPSFPKRWMLLAGGPAAGFALGLVLMFLVELILRPIRDPATLTQLLGEVPLGVIPTVSARGGAAKRGWFGRRKAQA